jgi:1,2-diacylglycerol 3-alpha-glucosyltransferase
VSRLAWPLRVALFSDSALPVLNGVSVSIDVQMQELRRRGHSVHLYTSRYPDHRDSDPNVVRFASARTPWTKDYPLAVPPFYAWFREFKRLGFDVVHTHTPFTLGMVGLRWAQSLELPVVSTYHTHYDKYAHYVPFFPKRYVRYKVAKHTNYYYSRVDHVLTPSPASKRWLARHSVRTPVTVVPTGVPDPKPIGRSEARARLGTVISAAREVMLDDPKAVLWVVGDGPARDLYQAQAREAGIGDRVRFWGFVPRAELDPYYAASDVFVFASMTETQGLVVTEAMSHGLPAVVVRGGGASAAVRDGVDGCVVRNDPAEVRDAVRRLLAEPDLYRQMSASAAQAARQCTVSAMVDRIESVYADVTGSSGRLREASLV